MQNRSKIFAWAAFGALLACAGALYLTHLTNGTPSWQRNLQIFQSREDLEKQVPVMVEQRKKFYESINKMLDPKSEFKETYDRIFQAGKEHPFFGPISADAVSDRVRGYLLGVTNSDEQNTMQALSRLNPLKGKFNPGVYTFYGGFYYYTCGAALMTAKIAGKISLSTDLGHYFAHPEETAGMYAAIRAVGAVSIVLTLILLFLLMMQLYGAPRALLAASFFTFFPLLVPYAHMAKSHCYGMFLLFAGFFFLWKTLREPDLKYYLLGGFFLGGSAGSIITNLTVGSVIFIVELARNDWSIRPVFKNSKFWAACVVFFAVYYATNFYIYADYDSFKRTLQALSEYMGGYGETYGQIQIYNWIPYLKDFFTNQLHWSILPLLLIGSYAAAKSRDKFLLAVLGSFAVLFLFDLAMTRHAGVSIRIFPMIAILCAEGVLFLFQGRPAAWKAAGVLLAGTAIFFSGLQCAFYSSLLKEPDSLMEAGQWVNAQVPRGETIGVVGGQMSQTSFPAIRFADYRMVRFPTEKENPGFSREDLPLYVIHTNPEHPILKQNYTVVREWTRPVRFYGIPFGTRWVISGNTNIYIFKKA